MLKILVVDDEPLQVKTLSSIIKSMKPEFEVFEAADGKEALDFLLSNNVDAVITDIRMPCMSGLEMIEKISQAASKPEIVILSGYGEFKYAQKAINFGVSEYLLKPVSKSDIKKVLDTLQKKIEQKKTEQDQKNGIIKKLENTLPVYIEHQLNRWVNDGLDASEEEEIREIFPNDGYVNVLVAKIKKFDRITCMYGYEEIKRLLQHFKFMMKESLNPIGHSISFFSEKSRDMMITILTSQDKFDLRCDKNEKALKSFISLVKDELGLTVTVGAGNTSLGIYQHVGKCYQQALAAVERRFLIHDKEVIHFNDIGLETEKNRMDVYSFEAELSGITQRAIDNMTVKAINDIFNKYMNRLNAVKPQKLKEYLHYSAIHMVKGVKHILDSRHYDTLVEEIRDRIFESENYMELKYVFIDIIEKISEYRNNKENKNNYMVVQKCKEYIDKNYMEDLSLESVSSRFHFSPSYFSNLFKNYAGVSFSEYLTAVRIEKAQYLLKNTNYKVYDISEKVGYKDPAYFNRIFKREVGISPYKFRQISSDL